MGAPYTHFDQLADLARGDEQVRSLFSKYALFVVVVFEPHRDAAFSASLAEQFLDLDRSTGPRLLFFAPIAPPPEWLDDPAVRRRPWVKDRVAGEVQPQVDDPAGAMRAAHILLGLPAMARPYLVVSSDLSTSEGLWMETTGEAVLYQLQALGTLATRLSMTSSPKLLEAGLAQIAEETGTLAGRLEPGLSPSAATSLAAVGSGLGADHRSCGKAEALVAKVFRPPTEGAFGPWSVGETGELEPDEEGLRRAQRSALDLAAARSIQPRERGSPAMHGPTRWRRPGPDFVEPYSQQLFELGDLVAGAPASSRGPLARLSFAAVLCWAVALEVELNASLGHVLRSMVGVRLPEHYGVHQPKIRGAAIRLDARTEIPFNRESSECLPGTTRRLWLPPELGNLRRAAEVMWRGGGEGRPNLPPDVGALDVPSLFEPWTRLTRVRNKAAHQARVTAAECREARAARDDLLASEVLARLGALKAALAGRVP